MRTALAVIISVMVAVVVLPGIGTCADNVSGDQTTAVTYQAKPAMKISPQMLKKLQTKPTRAQMIDALMASPQTKSSLESKARSAGLQVTQLRSGSLVKQPTEKTVDKRAKKHGPPVASATQAPPQPPDTKLITDYDFRTGVKISMIKKPDYYAYLWNGRRWYQEPIGSIALFPSRAYYQSIFMNDYIQGDYFPSYGDDKIIFWVSLPVGKHMYAIAIQGIAGIAQNKVTMRTKGEQNAEIIEDLEVTRSDDIGGFVAIADINVLPFREGVQDFGRASFTLVVSGDGNLHGITITRLF